MKSKFILLSSALLMSATAFAQMEVKTGGQKNVVVHEGTGAWCPWCIDGALVCDAAVAADPHMIAISVHDNATGSPTADQMEIPDGATWNTTYNTGYPYASVDAAVQNVDPNEPNSVGFGRNSQWYKTTYNDSYWFKFANDRKAMPVKYDLTVKQSYDKTSKVLTVTVTGKALTALTGKYNFNVCILEDKVMGSGPGWDQKNAYANHASFTDHPYYSKPATLTNYEHMRVLRAMLGGTWGTAAVTDPAANSEITKTFTYTVTDPTKIPNMKVVGYVQKNGAATTDREILNAVQAKMIGWATNIAAASNFAELGIYPNPATNLITVKAQLEQPADTKITISNLIGQVVFNQTYPAAGSMFGATIPVENLSNGVYMVTVTSNGSTSVEKVTITK